MHGGAVGLGSMQADRVADLARDAPHGVEPVERALDHERDLRPAHVAHSALGSPVDVHHAGVGLQIDRPRERAQAGREQVQHGQRRGGLAAARLARQAERLAALQLEGDARDDLHVALARVIADVQIIHAQDGRTHGRRAWGSAAHSITWPTAKKASTNSVMATPGGTTYHHAP